MSVMPHADLRSIQIVSPEPGRVEVSEQTIEPPGPGEVLIEGEASLISPGTERAWFLNAPDTPGRFPYRPGYCHVGRVVAVGQGVTGFSPGERVLSRAHHASLVKSRVDRLRRVPAGLSPDLAPFAVLSYISLQGVRKAQIELGSSVCVLGAGLIGLLAAQFARLMGASPLYIADLSAYRLQVAATCGLENAVTPDALSDVARGLTEPELPDAGFHRVIDATGHPAAFNAAIGLGGSQAVLVLLGSTRGRAQDVNVYDIHRKGLRIVGAHGRNCPPEQSYRDMWTEAANTDHILSLIDEGRLAVEPLITDRVAPTGVPAVFERLKESDERLLGCIIKWKDESLW